MRTQGDGLVCVLGGGAALSCGTDRNGKYSIKKWKNTMQKYKTAL